MKTAGVRTDMLKSSLRRGFLPITDGFDVLSPYEFKELCLNRIKTIQEEIKTCHAKLGRPNKKNLKDKFKGCEHKLGRNQYIAKRYFDLGDEVQYMNQLIISVNDWVNDNSLSSKLTDFDLLAKAIFLIAGDDIGKKSMGKFNELKKSQGYDDKKWVAFLDKITNL